MIGQCLKPATPEARDALRYSFREAAEGRRRLAGSIDAWLRHFQRQRFSPMRSASRRHGNRRDKCRHKVWTRAKRHSYAANIWIGSQLLPPRTSSCPLALLLSSSESTRSCWFFSPAGARAPYRRVASPIGRRSRGQVPAAGTPICRLRHRCRQLSRARALVSS